MAATHQTLKNLRGRSLNETDRLSTLDDYGTRLFVIPAEVKGRFRKWRNRVYWLLIAFFLILPWTKMNGVQSLWLDIPNRRFSFFGLTFFAHDTPLIFFILAIAVLSLALVTAIWGRVWCGWICPQTVFIDAIYRKIEIWIEGDYIERRRRYARPIDGEKLFRYILKWISFFVVSSLIAHSFVAYFTGSEPLIAMIKGSPKDNWNYFLITSSMTTLLLFDFGWFREQFCLIMCPYGRFQSVLMDENSMTVLYDEKRGEPRKGSAAKDITGDCVNCFRCVQVCPTRIDIRDGMQMECIGCTACIDACDEIMRKVNKPEGLIRYHALSGQKANWKRPSILVYSALIAICVLGFGYNVVHRSAFAANILRPQDSPYQMLPNEMLSNHLRLHLHNQTNQPQQFEIKLGRTNPDLPVEIRQAATVHHVGIGANQEVHFFVIFPASLVRRSGQHTLFIDLNERISHQEKSFQVELLGPSSSENSTPSL